MIIVCVLAFLGLFCIYLEFFLPGAILGISGGILLIASLVAVSLKLGVWSLFFACLLMLAFLLLVIKLALFQIKNSSKKGTMYLEKDQQGFQGVSYKKEYIGKNAIVSVDLKPIGYIKIDGEIVSALSKEGYLEKGSEVKVIGGEGSYLIVKLKGEKK